MDDDRDIREALSEMLRFEGYRVETAENGVAALACLRTKHPCLVLLDLRMPVMDGYQVLEKLKQMPDLKDIPVAVVTAEYAPPAGSAGCIRKPVDINALLETAHRLCPDHAAAT